MLENKLQLEATDAIKVLRKRLTKAEKRAAELDQLFIRLYEDNVSGKVSDERYAMLSGNYEAEQANLKQSIQAMKNRLEYRNRERQIWNSSFALPGNKRGSKSSRRMCCEIWFKASTSAKPSGSMGICTGVS